MPPISVLSHDSIEELNTQLRLVKNIDLHNRIRMIIMVMSGASSQDISLALGKSRKWIFKWTRRYSDFGIDGLRSRPLGRPARLNHDQLEQLNKFLIAKANGNDCITFDMIRQEIKSAFAIEYSDQGLVDMLLRNGAEPVRTQSSSDRVGRQRLLWKLQPQR